MEGFPGCHTQDAGSHRVRPVPAMYQPTNRHAWLQGGDAHCDRPPNSPRLPRRVVLLGAPGVGKGTQAAMLSEAVGACCLSTGDLFRTLRSRCQQGRLDAELSGPMREALECMARGELVHDRTVIGLVYERSKCLACAGGFLLDGFPRTVNQAWALDGMLAEQRARLDIVLNYDLPDAELIARLSGRMVCPGCKAVYHLRFKPPARAGICNACQTDLEQREDDRPEAIRVRLVAYRDSIAALLRYYRQQNLLVTVSAEGNPEQVFARTLAVFASEDALAR